MTRDSGSDSCCGNAVGNIICAAIVSFDVRGKTKKSLDFGPCFKHIGTCFRPRDGRMADRSGIGFLPQHIHCLGAEGWGLTTDH